MTVRLGRVLREMLKSVLYAQTRPEILSSLAIDLFAHKYRKALRELRSSCQRQMPPKNPGTRKC
jgi:hypothetical protein